MTLAKKIQQVLKDELKPENIKTVIDLAEFLKFKENQYISSKINEAEQEYLSEKERHILKKLDKNTQLRVIKAENQLPLGDVKNFQENTDDYRLRVGNYRIIFKNAYDTLKHASNLKAQPLAEVTTFS